MYAALPPLNHANNHLICAAQSDSVSTYTYLLCSMVIGIYFVVTCIYSSLLVQVTEPPLIRDCSLTSLIHRI